MATETQHRFPPPVKVLLERRLPERATPAGYSALIETYGLAVPVPRTLHASGARHRIVEADGWRILTPRQATPRPEADARRAPHLRPQARGPRPCVAEAALPPPRRRTDRPDGACRPDRRLRQAHLGPVRVVDGSPTRPPRRHARALRPRRRSEAPVRTRGKERGVPAHPRQPARHSGLLPAGVPHGRTRAPHRQRPLATRPRSRRRHPP